MKTGENQFQLAGIVVDVTNGENGWGGGLKALSIDRNEIFLKIEAEIGDWSQLHRQAVEGQQYICVNRCLCLGTSRLDENMAEISIRITVQSLESSVRPYPHRQVPAFSPPCPARRENRHGGVPA